jgi:hypothetical protein
MHSIVVTSITVPLHPGCISCNYIHYMTNSNDVLPKMLMILWKMPLQRKKIFLLILNTLRSQRDWYARVTYKKESAKGHWLLGPSPGPVGRSACRSLAQNPEHRTDASARFQTVAWSSRPLAAVYSGIVHRWIRPARGSSKGTSAPAESTTASAAPCRPVVPEHVLQSAGPSGP